MSATGLPDSPYVDVGLYSGPYPFRRLPAAEPEGLRSLLRECRAEAAIVTPFPALFYNRSWDGLREWLEAFVAEPEVRFWAVLRPDEPDALAQVWSAAAHAGIAGLRLFPRYHGYGLDDAQLAAALREAAETDIPVNLTARLLDDRLHPRPLRADPPLAVAAVSELLGRHPEVRWVLSGFYAPELGQLFPRLRELPEAYADIGCVKPPEFWWQSAVEQFSPERLLVGTGAPLYYHGGTRLSLARSGLAAEVLEMLLRGNARRLLLSPAGARGVD